MTWQQTVGDGTAVGKMHRPQVDGTSSGLSGVENLKSSVANGVRGIFRFLTSFIT